MLLVARAALERRGSTVKLARAEFDERVLDDVLSQPMAVIDTLLEQPKSSAKRPRTPAAQRHEIGVRRLTCAVASATPSFPGASDTCSCGNGVGGSGSGSLDAGYASIQSGAKAHRDEIVALAGASDSPSSIDPPLVSASKDGEVKLWQFPSLDPLRAISLASAVAGSLRPKDEGPFTVTSLALHPLGNRAMISTRKGVAYELSIWSGVAMPLVAGHVGEELWGVSAHPTDPDVAVSCGEEGSLCKWSLADRRSSGAWT